MKAFTAKYGIKITDANPEGSSQDELNAIKQLKGQGSAPDVVDVGGSFAITGQQAGDWAPYKVATWNDIPAAAKDADRRLLRRLRRLRGDRLRLVQGEDPADHVQVAAHRRYKNQVAIDGNPTQTGSAFAAVYAAALANGGSLANIAPGVSYFKSLKQAGNFVPVEGTPATVQSGQTPILIWWDYLLASEVQPVDKNFKIVIPTDGVYAGYYDQAISATAPHPAAARLWEEFLYSTEGQNLFLGGSTRPIEMAAMTTAGTIDQSAAAKLPAVPGSATLTLPTVGAADHGGHRRRPAVAVRLRLTWLT